MIFNLFRMTLAVLPALCFVIVFSSQPSQSAPAPTTKTKKFTNSIGMKMVLIPAGKFTMGSPEGEANRNAAEIQHDVEISQKFFLGAHHVTQAQYKKVIGKNPSYFCSTGGGSRQVNGLETGEFPVETVTWNDAVAFCKKLSEQPAEKAAKRVYRLPSEAEWEYACRGGAKESAPYFFGKTLEASHANFGRKVGRSTKVGSYKPNAWGLYDMHGNVWHMCADFYDIGYYKISPKKDPQGPKTGTTWVARGGSWSNGVQECRSASRAFVTSGQQNFIVGFRVACDVGKKPAK
jgi:formylglycine-generating enzyme required for sulfatase activity